MARKRGSQPGTALQEAVLRAAGDWNTALGVRFWKSRFPGRHRAFRPQPGRWHFRHFLLAADFRDTEFCRAFGYADSSRSRWGRFEETDLLFNPAHEWQVYDGSLRYDAKGDRVAELHRVALHEMGHLLGLTHPADDSEFTIMRSKMSDVDALSDIDRADARRVADRLFLKNRPRVFSPRDSRVTTRRNRLVVRGGTNLLFVKKAWLEIRSRLGMRTVPLPSTSRWEREIRLDPGMQTIVLRYRLRGGTAPSRACGSASPWSEAGGARGQLRSASASTSAMRSISSRVL